MGKPRWPTSAGRLTWETQPPVMSVPRFKSQLSIKLGSAGLMTSATTTAAGKIKGTQSAGSGGGRDCFWLSRGRTEAAFEPHGREAPRL